MHVRRYLAMGLVVATTAVAVAACSTAPADRRSEVDALTEQIHTMPGVATVESRFGDGGSQGPAFFEVDVDVVDGITSDQLAAIVSRYLDDLETVGYPGYRTELDVRAGDNSFVVDEPFG